MRSDAQPVCAASMCSKCTMCVQPVCTVYAASVCCVCVCAASVCCVCLYNAERLCVCVGEHEICRHEVPTDCFPLSASSRMHSLYLFTRAFSRMCFLSGKSAYVSALLSELDPDKFHTHTLIFSAQTTAQGTQVILDRKVRGGGQDLDLFLYSWTIGRILVFLCSHFLLFFHSCILIF